MARDNPARHALTLRRKSVGGDYLAALAATRLPLGFKLLAALAVSLVLWAAIFWLAGLAFS